MGKVHEVLGQEWGQGCSVEVAGAGAGAGRTLRPGDAPAVAQPLVVPIWLSCVDSTRMQKSKAQLWGLIMGLCSLPSGLSSL